MAATGRTLLPMRGRFLPSVLLLVTTGAVPARARAQGAEALTLGDVLARARTASPGSVAALARAAAAEASARQARRWPNPTAEVRTENWRLGNDPDFTPSTDVDVVATLDFPLPLFTAPARSAQAAAAARAAGAEAVRQRRALLREAGRLYLEAVRSRRLAASLASSREELAEVVRVGTSRVAEGWSPEGDLLKLRAEEARVAGEAVRAEVDLLRATSELGALLGEGKAVDPSRLRPTGRLSVPAGDPAALAEEALRESPDVLLARERLSAAREAARLARALRLPEPSLVAGYKRTGGLDTAVAGLSFPFPLFDRNAGDVARADAEARAAEADLAAAEASARAAAAARVLSARALLDRCAVVERELVTPAEGALEAARAAFREGVSNVLALVDAERVRTDSLRDALDLEVDANLTALEVLLDLGREEVP